MCFFQQYFPRETLEVLPFFFVCLLVVDKGLLEESIKCKEVGGAKKKVGANRQRPSTILTDFFLLPSEVTLRSAFTTSKTTERKRIAERSTSGFSTAGDRLTAL